MIFLETENLHLKVPNKSNLKEWTTWINSSFVRQTIPSTLVPTTLEMQWKWVQNELESKKRILLQICDKIENNFLGIVSLSEINYENRSAQIATLSPINKNFSNRFCVYEARKALVEYSFRELSLNKIRGSMIYPQNSSFMANNMCIGFEIEGVTHDQFWLDNKPLMTVNYFVTRAIYEDKMLWQKKITDLMSKKNRYINSKKLSKILSTLCFHQKDHEH